MRVIIASLLSFFLLNVASAQKITFKVLDISSGLPVSNVKVSSLPEHRFVTYGNDKGEFSLHVSLDDTIELQKPDFHVLLFEIKSHNFDSLQTLVLGMVPLVQSSQKISSDYNNLQKFEYHFIHDTLGGKSGMEIHVFENVHAVKQRTKTQDQSFKIGAVNLDQPPSVADPNRTYKSPYRLIKK